MGIFEKRRFRNFLQYVQEFDENDPKTWKGMDPNQSTATQLYEKFSLDANTQDFTGHALALYLNDEWVHTYTWTHDTVLLKTLFLKLKIMFQEVSCWAVWRIWVVSLEPNSYVWLQNLILDFLAVSVSSSILFWCCGYQQCRIVSFFFSSKFDSLSLEI